MLTPKGHPPPAIRATPTSPQVSEGERCGCGSHGRPRTGKGMVRGTRRRVVASQARGKKGRVHH
ncbi:uncharacterized protein B0I36DRAFT_342118 [Microdochium trichocladiopsis]|uniref:Uncharacterized protein n=1 Tax=Microdochium trichocladiopsis TaxID=1682393 RepID=A0A9P8XSI1_9PEZI|nr:uncharacterized protein B0I36DRAFT_342118 [Microdochium trichocladiopsis]KAH7009356.1 hypothetical protein B0I36DRAFT_342118 [Microdochium trichocladiopsis]